MVVVIPEDCHIDIRIRDTDLDPFGRSPLRRLDVIVELRSARAQRLKEEEERRVAREARKAQGVEDEDMDDYEEYDEPSGIARMEGFLVTRDFCRGDFFEVMDESDELHEFSVHFFDKNGLLRPEFIDNDYHKGTGCFGTELNEGTLIYVDTVKVNPEYRNQGLGSWMLQQFLQSNNVYKFDFVVLWPAAIEDRWCMTKAQIIETRIRLEAFFYKHGFRRLMRTHWFAWSKDPEHASHRLQVSEDATCNENLTYHELLEVQRPPKSYSPRDLSGIFPLHHAIVQASPERAQSRVGEPAPAASIDYIIAKMYLENPDIVHQQDASGMTPLHMAAGTANLLAIETLLHVQPHSNSAHSDLLRRDNRADRTPLELVEGHMRSMKDFTDTMLRGRDDREPYPIEGLKCAYTLRKAMGESLGTVDDYVKLKQWGCTCNQCTDGWFSPRMRHRFEHASELYADLTKDCVSHWPPNAFASFDSIRVALGLEFNPVFLWPKINLSFVHSFSAAIEAITEAATDPDGVPTLANLNAIVHHLDEAQLYLQQGGRMEYVLDYIIDATRGESLLEDGGFDELMDDPELQDDFSRKWKSLPVCANDLNFELVRERSSLGKRPLGPYRPPTE